MKPIIVLSAAALLTVSGCAVYRMDVRPSRAELETFSIKEIKNVAPVHNRTVLFVNQAAGVEQECLVFNAFYSQDQLLRPSANGLFDLNVAPVGYFKVKPALDATSWGERLVGFFEPRGEYTILVFAKTFDGGVVEVRTLHVVLPVHSFRTKYFYYILGRPAEKFVNHVVFLPSYYSLYGSNTATIRVDVNMLVRRAIGRIAF